MIDTATLTVAALAILVTLIVIGVPISLCLGIVALGGTALTFGSLELGVATLLENRRPEAERSASWQARRRAGIDAALPVMAGWAARVARVARDTGTPCGIVALSYAVALDWLSFRLPGVAWRDHADLARLADEQLSTPRFRITDPRDA